MSIVAQSQRRDTTEISADTQRARVKDILRSAGDRGVCSLAFYSLSLPNGRTRVYELRDRDGLHIDTVPCKTRDYHAGEKVPNHVRFIYRWNGNPHQLQLLRRGI